MHGNQSRSKKPCIPHSVDNFTAVNNVCLNLFVTFFPIGKLKKLRTVKNKQFDIPSYIWFSQKHGTGSNLLI